MSSARVAAVARFSPPAGRALAPRAIPFAMTFSARSACPGDYGMLAFIVPTMAGAIGFGSCTHRNIQGIVLLQSHS